MAHRSEQGSILGFVLVGALLVGLLVGSIYMVKNHHPSSVNVATKDQSKTSSDTRGQGAPATPDTSSDKKNTGSSSDQQLKAALDAQSNSNQQSASQSTNGAATSTGAAVGNLPTTGPEQIIGPLFGAMLLVGTSASYIRSRRLI